MKKRNRKSFGKIINWQRTRVREGSNTGNGDSSPYWQWIQQHSEKTDEGEFKEPSQANPDMIGDYDSYQNERYYYQEVLEEGYKILSLREKQVCNLLQIGYTNEQIAKRLNINESSVETYRDRIKNKFLKLVRLDA